MPSQKSTGSKKSLVPTEKLFNCHLCGQSFLRGCGLASHLRKHNTGDLSERTEPDSKENEMEGKPSSLTAQAEPEIRKSGRVRRKVTWLDAGYDDEDDESSTMRAPPKKLQKVSKTVCKASKAPRDPKPVATQLVSSSKHKPKKHNILTSSHQPEASQKHEEPIGDQSPENLPENPLVPESGLTDKPFQNNEEPEEAGNRPLKYFLKELAIEESRECADCSYKNNDIVQFRLHRDKHFYGYHNRCSECNYTATHPKFIRKHLFEDHFLQDVKYVEGISSSESEEEEIPVFQIVQEKPKKRRRRRRRDKW
uniref:C2H2-type domain-containing protein n=1 Tax=Caenorhabditis tropicalis TaxID=1561998 RepID=A0A1I7TXA0_9PELO